MQYVYMQKQDIKCLCDEQRETQRSKKYIQSKTFDELLSKLDHEQMFLVKGWCDVTKWKKDGKPRWYYKMKSTTNLIGAVLNIDCLNGSASAFHFSHSKNYASC